MSDEENPQAVAVQLKLLEDYYQDLSGRESILLRLYREEKASLASMTALKDMKSADLLVNIGGGAHLPVSFTGGGKVVVDIGAGVAIEKAPDDAISYLTARIKEIEDTLGKVSSQKKEVADRMEAYQQQLELSQAPEEKSKEPEPPPGDA
jgi:prefoldin alpha subunit